MSSSALAPDRCARPVLSWEPYPRDCVDPDCQGCHYGERVVGPPHICVTREELGWVAAFWTGREWQSRGVLSRFRWVAYARMWVSVKALGLRCSLS